MMHVVDVEGDRRARKETVVALVVLRFTGREVELVVACSARSTALELELALFPR
jgi:hypothetical protein